MDLTTRLLLQKPDPDPETGDFVDVNVLNANADKIDATISATPCTSSTRPASPFQGQIIMETDTGMLYVRSGSTWLQIPVDVNLYRDSPSRIKTNNDLEAVGFLVSGTMRSVMAEDDTDQNSITNTTGTPGTPAVGVGFTVPPSGRVWVHVSGNVGQSTNGNNTYLGYELRQGSTTVGSGTLFQGYSSNRALGAGKAVVSGGANENAATRSVYITGLTPGSTANVRLGHWVTPAGSGTVFFRQIVVTPDF